MRKIPARFFLLPDRKTNYLAPTCLNGDDDDDVGDGKESPKIGGFSLEMQKSKLVIAVGWWSGSVRASQPAEPGSNVGMLEIFCQILLG